MLVKTSISAPYVTYPSYGQIWNSDWSSYSNLLSANWSWTWSAYPTHSGIYVVCINSFAAKRTSDPGWMGGAWGEFNISKNGTQLVSMRWENQGGTQNWFSNGGVCMVQLSEGDEVTIQNFVGQQNDSIQVQRTPVDVIVREI